MMRIVLAALFALASIGLGWAAGLDEAGAAMVAARRGDFDAAIRGLTAALAAGDLSPRNVMLAHHNRGNAYQDKGDYTNAIADYDAAIALKADYAEAYYARGRARFALGEFSVAAADFTQSLKLDPMDAYAVLWLHLAKSRSSGADLDELAKSSAKLAQAEWPGPLIALYLGKGTADQAREAARQSPGDTATERDCEAAFYIGEHELLRKNVAGAVVLFQEALKTCPFTTDELDGAQVELKRLH